jgi:DAK2 domain fusion protein YloV
VIAAIFVGDGPSIGSAPVWRRTRSLQFGAVTALDRPAELFDAELLRRTVVTYRDTMQAHAAGINRLNVYPVPDGDTGTNMARTLDAVVAELDQAAPGLASTCHAISHGSLMGARGNSGVILSQILRGLTHTLLETEDATPTELAEALSAASAAAYQAVLKPVEGTILTVCREAAEAARARAAEGGDIAEVLRAARAAGRTALEHTPDLLPVLRDAGVVDAGGAGFLLLLDAALHVVDGEPLPEPEAGIGPTLEQLEAAARRHHDGTGLELDVSELRYEVMYFLDLDDARIDEFKERWGEIGDSIVVVGGDGLWNCHVHTNDVGAAIEVALDLDGRPRQIRVTDLFDEVEEEHAQREAELHGTPVHSAPGGGLPPVTTAVVAVCSGDGLAELFGQLGVQGAVTGGQTMNPSTAELLEAVAHVNARQVILLPNNKNIIPVAEQVDALSDKHVMVVPTRSMPEALAALVVYDPEGTVEANHAAMCEAIATVGTGEVTRAVRDSVSEAGPVHAGDWIGLVRGDGIVSVASDPVVASTTLLDHLIRPSSEIVTIIEGLDADRSSTEAIEAWLAEHHPDVVVERHRGGQPLYPYLFGVE